MKINPRHADFLPAGDGVGQPVAVDIREPDPVGPLPIAVDDVHRPSIGRFARGTRCRNQQPGGGN